MYWAIASAAAMLLVVSVLGTVVLLEEVGPESEGELSDEVRRRLRSLGYVE